jgi:hypothetical protein
MSKHELTDEPTDIVEPETYGIFRGDQYDPEGTFLMNTEPFIWSCGHVVVALQIRGDGDYFAQVGCDGKVLWTGLIRRDLSAGASVEHAPLRLATIDAIWLAIRDGCLDRNSPRLDCSGDELYVGQGGHELTGVEPEPEPDKPDLESWQLLDEDY